MHEVESIANDDQWELIGKFGLLEEILNFLGIVEVALSADTLNLAYLTSTCGSLDVLEVNLGIFAQDVGVLSGDLDDNL